MSGQQMLAAFYRWVTAPDVLSHSGEVPNTADTDPIKASRSAWWVVFRRELEDLWVGGKGAVLLILYCAFVGGTSLLQVTLSESDMIPPKELIYSTLMLCLTFGVLMNLVLGADSISGERERGTLEALLVTPASRPQIVFGKFLAALTPWPIAFAITAPYLAVLAQGDPALTLALIWGGLVGTLLAASFTGLGMVVSLWSNANRVSLFVTLTTYLMFYLPTQLPSGAQTGIMGRLFKRLNPLESVGHWLEKIIVNNRNPLEFSTDPRGGGWLWLIAPTVLAWLVLGALAISARLVQLEANLATAIPGMLFWHKRRRQGSSKKTEK
ncbi:MAG TPA: ABC transporter permease subunit [Vicinamibacterales bacterium]|jgi:ABC-2 type transport system permease protein